MTSSVHVVRETPAECAQRWIRRLRAELGSDGGALLLMDPVTRLFTSGAVDALPESSCHPFFAFELSDEPRTFRRMAAQRARGSTVSDVHEPDEPFVRDVLVPHGHGAEIRAVCADTTAVWGGVSLWRQVGAAPFRAGDVGRLDRLVEGVASDLRAAVVGSLGEPTAVEPAAAHRAAVVLDAGDVVEGSPDLDDVLRELGHSATDEYRHLDHLRALASRDPQFSTVIRTTRGWLTAHGTPLGRGRVAVTITAAGPEQLLGARVVAAGLTMREIEVTRLLCRGLSEREIARELGVSAHTAHDHVRSVRRKLGVRSRAEVSATIFAERYFDRFLGSAALSH